MSFYFLIAGRENGRSKTFGILKKETRTLRKLKKKFLGDIFLWTDQTRPFSVLPFIIEIL